MSSLLGYRPPQFSEESPWLPTCFQHPHAQTLDAAKHLDNQFMNKYDGEDVIMSLEDEGRYKSCHLFLSGEDMPSASPCPSSANVGDFRLYLSSDGISQDLYGSGLGTFKEGNSSLDYVALVQKTAMTFSQEVKGNQCTMHHDCQETSARPLTSECDLLEHPCPQFLGGNVDTKMKSQENLGTRNVSEISKAVELSIAAAEALIIDDMVKSSSSTECFSSGAILEVALRVQQARLECSEDSFYSSEEGTDMDESVLQFHESDMEDAFEDVGLIVSGSTNLVASAADISQVKETPNSENYSVSVSTVDAFVEKETTDIVDMDNQERRNLSARILNIDGNRTLENDPTCDLTTPFKAPPDDVGLQWSVVEKTNSPAAVEEIHLPPENMTPPPKKANKIFAPQSDSSANAEREDKHLYCPDKFQSRWLGGWMWKKEMNASATVTCKSHNLIPKLVVNETSFLSESADIGPDKNSHIQIQDEGSFMASQPSISFRGLHEGADEGLQFSPDTTIPSCLSLVDPLCSVVPCSLSPAHACPSKTHDSNYVEDTEERLVWERRNDNLQSTSTLDAEFLHGETILEVDGKASHSTIRRKFTSLRTYSTLLPHNSLFSEKDRNHDQQPISPKRSISLSSEKNLNVGEIEENQEIPDKKRPGDFETWIHNEKDPCPALILNHGKRHRVSACKEIHHDSNGGKTLEEAPISKSAMAHLNSDLQKDRLRYGASNEPEMPTRKRVRFSEASTRPLQKTNANKQFSRKSLAARAGRKIKSSNSQLYKKSQINGLSKSVKRSIFQNLDFLLTGFPGQKERKIKKLIMEHGGTVLFGIPSPNPRGRRSSRLLVQQHPVILCPHKLETTEFLYGCAVNAFMLRVDWLMESVKAGFALAPDKYMVLSNHGGERSIGKSFCHDKHNFIFDGVGVMLHGTHSFCSRFATIIKHGGGKVYKTLQLMVQNLDAKMITLGIIVVEDERNVSRHLKYCASERKILTTTASWIIKSLHDGKLLPFPADIRTSSLPKTKILDFPDSSAYSQEI